MLDLTNCKCFKCNKGTFQEASIFDDIDGTLHCNNCNYKVKRYASDDIIDPNLKD